MNKNRLLLLSLCAVFAQNAVAGSDKLDRDYPGRMLEPGDPLVYQQWYLLNTGQDAYAESGGVPGIDLNLWQTHKKGILGKGVTVAVIDDGLELRHPNLAPNMQKGSYNFLDGSSDTTPTDPNAAHGTSVAGIIAAAGFNNLGTRGVAPKAGLKGYNWLKSQSHTNWLLSHGLDYRTSDVRVFNQSYGSSPISSDPYDSDVPFDPENIMLVEQMDYVYEDKSLNAFNGKGALYVKSAGNGYKKFGGTVRGIGFNFLPADYDSDNPNQGLPWQNSNFTHDNANYWNMTVSALNADGVRSSYSSVGSNVYLTAPGGEYGAKKPAHVTTDLVGCYRGYNTYEKVTNGLHGGTPEAPNCSYNGRMNGTSSAAPNTSGAAALLMSAYPKLSQRDIRHLLARTATKVDPDYGDITITYTANNGTKRTVTGLEGWSTNAAGFDYSPFYGFGLIDVDRALKLGKTWNKLPKLKMTDWVIRTPRMPVPDAGFQPVADSVWVKQNLVVEAVQVKVDINHERISDLLIELVSPSGTRSVLMSPRNGLVGRSLKEYLQEEPGELERGYRDHLLLTHKFFGEQAKGDWRLEVTDTSGEVQTWILQEKDNKENIRTIPLKNNAKPGLINHWSLRVLGHKQKG